VIGSWEPKRFIQTKARGYRLAKVLLDDDDKSFFAFGIREANNELRLLNFSTPIDKRDLELTEVARLPGMTLQSKFAASIYSPPQNAQLQPHVWIADIQGHSVRMIPVLDEAARAPG
jgi:hypothetical protein